ncbi:uroporphyrinogen-III synthase [Rhizobium sp. C4]|uniref:uroporphyrinogen-III synthase n=1 Tax=Rhizobium sp. C4 TaxID=1349800 RepID=UPI001E4B0A28|nr:uroporphyrinogen-III synthase [Rhizobium sp. C4]MCD2175484.1 uroporphyrinogen-III synthase [Rhizobium sp. C4]
MRILVTRPEKSAVPTGERLRALGHEPIFLPLFAAEHDPEGVALARACHDAAAVLVTSAEAVRAIGTAGDLADKPVFAVGTSTGKAAREAGFKQVETANGDGAALAALLRDRFPDADKPQLLYLAGEPRSPRLEQELAAARFRMNVIVCYRMTPVDLTREILQAAFQRQPEAVLLYSAETARRFFELAESFLKEKQDIQFLCLSSAIVEAVPAGMKSRTKSAVRPDERSLFELL